MINKVLVVGFGNIGKRHYKLLKKKLPKSEIKILKTKNTKIEKGFSKSQYIHEKYLEEFLPDISIISNPAPFHLYYAEKLLKLNSNIFIEKPLSDSDKKINLFLKKTKSSSASVTVGYNLRFLDSLIELKKLVDENIIGTIYSVKCDAGQYLPEWRNSDYRKSVSAKKSLGGGVLLELSHEIDYLNWIFGKISWVNSHISKISNLEIDVEDSATLMLGTSSNNPAIINLNLDFLRKDKSRSMTIIGENSSIRWQAEPSLIEIWNLKNKRWDNIFKSKMKIEDTYSRQWDSFLGEIKNNMSMNNILEESVETMKIIQASKKSSFLKGKRIKIDG